MSRNIRNISVLLGGWSSEREISLASGQNVANVLRNMGYSVSEIDVRKDLRYLVASLYDAHPDFIFNMLHGFGGEDGVIQGILDVFGVPYTGCSAQSSAICFDKAICKKIVQNSGVRVAEGFETTASFLPEVKKYIDYPFVVKPSRNGSSVGLFIVLCDEDWQELQKTDWMFGDKIIVEKYIKGREFTVCVIDGEILGSLEITFKNQTYDYKAKYEIGASSHISDFVMDKRAMQEMYEMSKIAFNACECSGLVRIDYRYDGDKVYFLEINTQPGMTSTSLVPDIARSAGLTPEDLLQKIIDVTWGKSRTR